MTQARSKDVINRYIKAYETGNQNDINAFLADEYAYFAPGGGRPMDKQERMRDESFFSAFSHITTTVEDELAEGNKVACRITMRCTQKGDFHGIPATGRRISITYMEMFLLRGEKILKEWAEFDMLTLLDKLK